MFQLRVKRYEQHNYELCTLAQPSLNFSRGGVLYRALCIPNAKIIPSSAKFYGSGMHNNFIQSEQCARPKLPTVAESRAENRFISKLPVISLVGGARNQSWTKTLRSLRFIKSAHSFLPVIAAPVKQVSLVGGTKRAIYIWVIYCYSKFQTIDVRRGVQSKQSHQLHRVLWRHYQWPHRGADAENIRTFWYNSGNSCF